MSKHSNRVRRGLRTKYIVKRHEASRPRLVVFRSNKHIFAQVVANSKLGDVVLVSCSTADTQLKSKLSGAKVEQAELVGKELAKRAETKGIKEVSFDRSGYKYHGRVRAVADGAREAGLII